MRPWPRRSPRPQIVIYTRKGCGLCRTAESLVRREARGADIRLVDVDADVALQDRYGVRVPVVAINGSEVAELEVDAGDIRAAVRRARRQADEGPVGRG